MKNINLNKKVFIALLAIIAVIGIGLTSYNSPENRLNRQIDLGQKYLEEAKYEEAVVVFNQVIEIEPMSSAGYLGLAEAYIGLGDWESAMEVLQKGYEMTGEEALQERKLQLENEHAERRVRELEAAMDQKAEEFQRIYSVWLSYKHSNRHLTVEQLKEVSAPYVSILEEYGNCRAKGGEMNNWTNNYYWLADYYLACGEYNKCLEIRKQAYDETGSEFYSTAERVERQDEDVFVYDQYGRAISHETRVIDGVMSDNYKDGYEYRYNDSGLLEEMKDYCIGLSRKGNEVEDVIDVFGEYTYDEEKRLIVSTAGFYSQDTGALRAYYRIEYDYHDSGFTAHHYEEDYYMYEIQEYDVDYTFNEYGEAIAGESYNRIETEK